MSIVPAGRINANANETLLDTQAQIISYPAHVEREPSPCFSLARRQYRRRGTRCE
jgi:hypothetical protein